MPAWCYIANVFAFIILGDASIKNMHEFVITFPANYHCANTANIISLILLGILFHQMWSAKTGWEGVFRDWRRLLQCFIYATCEVFCCHILNPYRCASSSLQQWRSFPSSPHCSIACPVPLLSSFPNCVHDDTFVLTMISVCPCGNYLVQRCIRIGAHST